MLRDHGVLSSHARLRGEVVAKPRDDAPSPPPRQLLLYEDNDELRLLRKPWAWLLRHVFLEDVTVCPQCQGPMRWVDVATDHDDIARVLARHDIAAPPRLGPAPRRLTSS